MKTTGISAVTEHVPYLERKRLAVLNFGYDLVIFRNRARKSMNALKRQIHLLSL